MGATGSAFEDAVPPLLPRMRRLARRVIANPALAEEAVQEAMLRAYRFWGTRHGAHVWPWLRRLVILECLRASARDGAQRRAAPVEGPTDTPPDVAVRREEHAEVRRAVDALPSGYRRVLVLHHGHGLTEAEVAAVLGLPLGTVKWRVKRAHDHLRQVLRRQATRPLAETLREVGKQMPLEVVLSVGRWPDVVPDPPDWPEPKEDAPPLVTLAEAQAEVPAFLLPPSLARPTQSARVMRKHDGSPRGVQYDVDGGGFGPDGGFTITYSAWDNSDRRDTALHFHMPFAQKVVFNEPTHIGPHEGRWWRVDDYQTVAWRAAGGFWMVRSNRPGAEIRRIAEEIAALQPPQPDEPARPQPPRTPPPPISAAEARRLFPGFTLGEAFLQRYSARILPLHRSREPAPDGLQVYCDGFLLWYIPAGAQPIRVVGYEILDDHTPVGGREAIWWRSEDCLAVSWPAADGGRWRVGGVKDERDLGRVAEVVAAATR